MCNRVCHTFESPPRSHFSSNFHFDEDLPLRLGLAQVGHNVTILEQARELREVGAGIQIVSITSLLNLSRLSHDFVHSLQTPREYSAVSVS